MQHAVTTHDTTDAGQAAEQAGGELWTEDEAQQLRARIGLGRGQRGLLRRYEQATARVERCRVAYVTAAAARSRYLAALRSSGLSERQLALLVGLSRAQVRAVAAAAAKELPA